MPAPVRATQGRRDSRIVSKESTESLMKRIRLCLHVDFRDT